MQLQQTVLAIFYVTIRNDRTHVSQIKLFISDFDFVLLKCALLSLEIPLCLLSDGRTHRM